MTNKNDLICNYLNKPYSAYQTSKLIRHLSDDDRVKSAPTIDIALMGTTTLDFLADALKVEGLINDLNLNVRILPAEQIPQQTLDPSSELYSFDPSVIIILARVEDLYPALINPTIKRGHDFLNQAKNEIIDQIESWIEAIRSNSSATIILHTFAVPDWSSDKTNEVISKNSLWYLVQKINLSFSDIVEKHTGVQIVNIDRVINKTPADLWHDPKLWYIGRISFGSKDPRNLIRCWLPIFNEIAAKRKKCLVVDLDNTLWGGVIGEDGLNGIKLGTDYPGNVYLDVQRQILDLWNNGVMLAIASKNNETDVKEVFDKHPHMILKWDHFLVRKINWDDKASNISEIASEINIGLSHIVFLDDNPAECSQVSQTLPDVSVLKVPMENICDYPSILEKNRLFDGSPLTDEDKKRNQMYAANLKREAAKPKTKDLSEFLSSLEMHAKICPISANNLSRSFQMINKTNQFNLTTKRYTEAEVEKIYQDKNWCTVAASLEDKFGDNGQVGLTLAEIKGKKAYIDIFLMSCRVINRGLESLMVEALFVELKARNIEYVLGEYIPTAKNGLVETFFENHGFELIETSATGLKKYQFKLTQQVKLPKHHIQFSTEEKEC